MSDRWYETVSEADWQAQVLDTLGYHGWRVAHFRTAMTRAGNFVTPVAGDGAGFPDLLAVHPKTGDMFVAELKSEKGRASAIQLQWLAWFDACGVDNFVWRPSDVDEVVERVQAPRVRMTLDFD